MPLRSLLLLSSITLTIGVCFASYQQSKPITKEAIIRACKPGKRERKPAASYIVMMHKYGVDFSPSAQDEAEIRAACKYLGRKELVELISAIRDQYELGQALARLEAVMSPSQRPSPSASPDWKDSDEAKKLANEMKSEIQQLIDEGTLINLTDYEKALSLYLAWLEKCSVTLGHVDIKIRRFLKEMPGETLKEEFDKSTARGRQTNPKTKESSYDKEMLRSEISIALIRLNYAMKYIGIYTRPDRDSLRGIPKL
jgi:hypothetical protein